MGIHNSEISISISPHLLCAVQAGLDRLEEDARLTRRELLNKIIDTVETQGVSLPSEPNELDKLIEDAIIMAFELEDNGDGKVAELIPLPLREGAAIGRHRKPETEEVEEGGCPTEDETEPEAQPASNPAA